MKLDTNYPRCNYFPKRKAEGIIRVYLFFLPLTEPLATVLDIDLGSFLPPRHFEHHLKGQIPACGDFKIEIELFIRLVEAAVTAAAGTR